MPRRDPRVSLVARARCPCDLLPPSPTPIVVGAIPVDGRTIATASRTGTCEPSRSGRTPLHHNKLVMGAFPLSERASTPQVAVHAVRGRGPALEATRCGRGPRRGQDPSVRGSGRPDRAHLSVLASAARAVAITGAVRASVTTASAPMSRSALPARLAPGGPVVSATSTWLPRTGWCRQPAARSSSLRPLLRAPPVLENLAMSAPPVSRGEKRVNWIALPRSANALALVASRPPCKRFRASCTRRGPPRGARGPPPSQAIFRLQEHRALQLRAVSISPEVLASQAGNPTRPGDSDNRANNIVHC